jgi:hypothetical protein
MNIALSQRMPIGIATMKIRINERILMVKVRGSAR